MKTDTAKDGYIKFNCAWTEQRVEWDGEWLSSLVAVRDALHRLGLIGVYPDGVGFGNVSARCMDQVGFAITGSATGGWVTLGEEHIAWVRAYSLERNCVESVGMIRPSSESLTHAAVYDALPNVNGVVHIHHAAMWSALLDRKPTTDRNILYGTPEMANAVAEMCRDNAADSGLFVLGGHEEGLLSYGQNVKEACDVILGAYYDFQQRMA